MDKLQSIRDTCIEELKTLSGFVPASAVARLVDAQDPEPETLFSLGDVYAYCFFKCTTETLGLKVDREEQDPASIDKVINGEMVNLPGYSADADTLKTLFDDLHLFPRPTAEQIMAYAQMPTEELSSAIIDIITGNGEGSTDADSILWRCVYAGYVLIQATQAAQNAPKTRHRADKDIAALSTSGRRQLSITNKKYQDALLPKPNKVAYVEIFDGSLFDNLRFDKNGMLEIGPGIEQRLSQAAQQGGNLEKYSVSLISQIYTAVFRARVAVTDQTVTIHIPTFCKEMGMDIQSGKANDIFAKLRVFENCMGVLDGKKYYALLQIIEIDQEANTLTFAAPYIINLMKRIAAEPAAQKKGKNYEYIIPGYSWLIHSAIVSERNEPAKHIVNYLIQGLTQRGDLPDGQLRQRRRISDSGNGQVTFSVTFKTILEHAPILRNRLATGTTADKNKKLKRAFLGAYELLQKRTDAYKYYKDLDVPRIFPTVTTLDRKLTITHLGRNPDYKRPFE